MTEDELLNSIKLHSHAVKNCADYDELAKRLKFDVEKAAQRVIAKERNDPL